MTGNLFLQAVRGGRELASQPYRNALLDANAGYTRANTNAITWELEQDKLAQQAVEQARQYLPAAYQGDWSAAAQALGTPNLPLAWNESIGGLPQQRQAAAIQQFGVAGTVIGSLLPLPPEARERAYQGVRSWANAAGLDTSWWSPNAPSEQEITAFLSPQQQAQTVVGQSRQGGGQAAGQADQSLARVAGAYQQAGLAFPISADTAGARISSRYGKRKHPVHGGDQMHEGLDIAAPEGTPVGSMAPGTVLAVEQQRGYGTIISVDHGNGIVSRYAHLGGTNVRPGDQVTAGQAIGTVGQSGNATGPSVHVEVLQNGQHVDPALFSGGQGQQQVAADPGAQQGRSQQPQFMRLANGLPVTEGAPRGYAWTADGQLAPLPGLPTEAPERDTSWQTVDGQRVLVDDQTGQILSTAGSAQNTAPQVNVNLPGEDKFLDDINKGAVDEIYASREAANTAVRQLEGSVQARAILDAGAITGTLADQRLAAAKALGSIFGEDPDVARTEALFAVLGKQTMDLLDNLGSGSGISDADLKFANRVAAGDITISANGMRRVLDINERAARKTIERHQQLVKPFLSDERINPGIRQLLEVQAPQLDQQQAAPQQASQQQAAPQQQNISPEGTVIENDQGERFVWQQGQWVPMP